MYWIMAKAIPGHSYIRSAIALTDCIPKIVDTKSISIEILLVIPAHVGETINQEYITQPKVQASIYDHTL